MLAAVTPEQLGFPHAATVFAVSNDITHKKTGATSSETRYFASSLGRGASTPRQWLACVRGHWRVESANHYRRDVTWRKDAELGRHARRACNLALLRSALLAPCCARAPSICPPSPSATPPILPPPCASSTLLTHDFEVLPESRGRFCPPTQRPVPKASLSSIR